MSLEINYIDAPEGAQDDMSVSGEYGNSVSDAALLQSGAGDVAYATLEPDVWKLDGSMRILPDTPKLGFWSIERSNADGYFEMPPQITLKFPVPYTSTGLAFTFSPSTEQWCSEIHVSWYNGQSLLMEGDYYPDSAKWILDENVESYDQIRIKLLATNHPNHLAKIQKIEVGRTVLFGREELINVRLVNETDPALCVLSADTMDFYVVDSKERELIPQENQRIELYKDGKLKAIQYVKSSTREAKNQYRFTCQSAIGLLEDTFLGGMYVDYPLEDLVHDILGEWPFKIDSYFDGTVISGYLPVCAQREALQQLAFAIGSIVSTQDGASIRFLPVPTTATVKFTSSEIFLGGSVKTSPRVAKVQVYSHSYTESDTDETLMQEEITGEAILVTFDSPHHSYSISGGTITSYGANWVRITADGPVTVTGKGYVHASVAHTKRNPAAVAKEQSNYIAVSDVTLIHNENVQNALERLFNVYQLRQVTEQSVIVTNQAAGDLAVSVTPWKSKTRGFISSMDSTLTQNGHTAIINIQGVEVALEAVCMYAGEIWSGGTEVVY